MKNTCILVHTHSDYSDLWVPFFSNLKKYGPISIDIYILLNKNIDNYKHAEILTNIISNCYILLYDQNNPYCRRIYDALEHISNDFILILHDNNILMNKTNDYILNICEKYMIDNNIDQFRLSCSGVNPIGVIDYNLPDELINIVYKFQNIDNYYYYSVYPCIWKKDSWNKLLATFITYSYREIEHIPVQEYTKKLNNYYITFQPDPDINTIFPSAHIIHYGKWELTHKKYIDILVDEYNLDIKNRNFIQS